MAEFSKQETSIDWVLYWLREKSDSNLVITQKPRYYLRCP